ncbi:MAG: hypothetical protein QM811_19565 [Pirellulales bacterium]
MDSAQATRREILEKSPEERKTRRDLAKGYFGWAFKLDEKPEQAAEALEQFRAAEREFAALLKTDVRSLDDRFFLGQARCWIGWKLMGIGDLPAARAAYESAQSVTEPLAAGNPDVEKYRIEAATLELDRGDLYAAAEEWPAARKLYQQASASCDAIVRKNPNALDMLRLKASACEGLADVELSAGDSTASIAARRAAIAVLRDLALRAPDPGLDQAIQLNEEKLPASGGTPPEKSL